MKLSVYRLIFVEKSTDLMQDYLNFCSQANVAYLFSYVVMV